MEIDVEGSQLYQPYLEIGRIVDSKVFIFKPPTVDDAVHSIVASVGKAYRIYNVEHLKVTYTSPQLPNRVRSLAYVDTWIFVASGFNVYGSKQGHEDIVFKGHTSKVEHLVTLGKFLISVSRDDTINVWNTNPAELYHSINELHNFQISAVLHPDTYVNKIVFGSKTGAMKLVNVIKKKVIFTFKGFGSPILCMEQSPAVDVVGVGCQNGNIYVHNLKFDQTIVSFSQTTAVSSLSFRTDATPMLVTGGADGTITMWDLEKKKLSMVLEGAHGTGPRTVTPYSTVHGVKFLAGEPLLISSGADNSIKTWLFDKHNAEPRLLRSKSGHYRPITTMKFYLTPTQQYTVITASQDHDMRIFYPTPANHSTPFSQGEGLIKQAKTKHVSLEVIKRNIVLDFDANTLYEKDWDNVLTCHEGENTAQTWRYIKNKIGAHKFPSTDPKHRNSRLKSVCISSCGNFGLIGSVNGWIDRYNMQSGLHRGSYVDDSIGRAHNGAIQGLVTDGLNRTLISGSLDGYLKFWDFASQKVVQSVHIGSPITKLLLFKENSLLAVVSDDFVIRIYDVITYNLVRKFVGHTNQIIDIVFNHDGRWLISASADTTIRTWDMVAGRLIDWFRVSDPVSALAFHPHGKFLITSHASQVGLFLWVNRAFYGQPLLRTLSDEAPLQSLPTSSGVDEERLAKIFEAPQSREFVPLDPSLLTLSDEPRQKFEIVHNIDVIKERNKPEKAPEKPASAPFFLPTLPGLNPQFVAPTEAKGEDFFSSDFGGNSAKKAKGEDGQPQDAEPARKLAAQGSKIMSLDTVDFKSKFEKKLQEGNAKKDYTEAFSFLKKLSPSGIDFEIQGLSLQNDYEELKWFMEMVTERLQAHDDYDMCQAILSVFLKHHNNVLMDNTELSRWLTELREQQHLSWLRIQREFHSSLCLIKYFSGIQM